MIVIRKYLIYETYEFVLCYFAFLLLCYHFWDATQKSCTIFLALKGRNIPAQGNALGKYKKNF